MIPCGCSQKTGTVRGSIREMFADLEKQHPRLKDTLLAALGNIEPQRLLDTRYLNLEAGADQPESELLPILQD